MTVHGNIIAFTLCLLALTVPAFSQQAPPCTDRAKMAEHLNTKYDESQTGAGLQNTSRIIEVWSSNDGSWTIVATDARGVSCILAAGTHWRNIEAISPAKGLEG